MVVSLTPSLYFVSDPRDSRKEYWRAWAEGNNFNDPTVQITVPQRETDSLLHNGETGTILIQFVTVKVAGAAAGVATTEIRVYEEQFTGRYYALPGWETIAATETNMTPVFMTLNAKKMNTSSVMVEVATLSGYAAGDDMHVAMWGTLHKPLPLDDNIVTTPPTQPVIVEKVYGSDKWPWPLIKRS